MAGNVETPGILGGWYCGMLRTREKRELADDFKLALDDWLELDAVSTFSSKSFALLVSGSLQKKCLDVHLG